MGRTMLAMTAQSRGLAGETEFAGYGGGKMHLHEAENVAYEVDDPAGCERASVSCLGNANYLNGGLSTMARLRPSTKDKKSFMGRLTDSSRTSL